MRQESFGEVTASAAPAENGAATSTADSATAIENNPGKERDGMVGPHIERNFVVPTAARGGK
jgi:hypothetical protein